MAASLSLTDLQTKREALLQHIKKQIPNFELRSKAESKFMRFLSKILFVVPRFMERKTSWFPHIYFANLPPKLHPDPRWNEILIIEGLTHEATHLFDRKRLWVIFNLLYIMPQIFAVFAFFALGTISGGLGWLCWLSALAALAPLPSPGRAWLEYRGFRAEMATRYWLTNSIVAPEYYASKFTSSAYYFTWPFRKAMIKRFTRDMERIVADDLPPDLRELKNALDSKSS